MNNSVKDFLIDKIKLNPEFAKMLSTEELKEIENYKKQQDKNQQKTYTHMQKVNMYSYHTSAYNTMYWNNIKHIASKPYLTKNNDYSRLSLYAKFGIINLTRNEFDNAIKNWLNSDNAPDPFADIKWLNLSEYLYQTTKDVVGDLIDKVTPKERFFICWHPSYTVKNLVGYVETISPHLSTIDMLRGSGVYPIVSYAEGKNINYFNENYFKSISELTEQLDIDRVIYQNYNFFTKEQDEKFALCECQFNDKDVRIIGMSELMTYEEHFKRLYGFLPVK